MQQRTQQVKQVGKTVEVQCKDQVLQVMERRKR